MKLVCPACGATASAETWKDDAAARETLALALKFPPVVQAELLPYLALFRPEARALSWSRAKTLVADLLEHVRSGQVAHDGKPPRPCPPALWAQAMREMSTKRGGQRAHFANHNYLRAVAYPLADKADAQTERQREFDRRKVATRDDPKERCAMPDEAREALRKLGLKK